MQPVVCCLALFAPSLCHSTDGKSQTRTKTHCRYRCPSLSWSPSWRKRSLSPNLNLNPSLRSSSWSRWKCLKRTRRSCFPRSSRTPTVCGKITACEPDFRSTHSQSRKHGTNERQPDSPSLSLALLLLVRQDLVGQPCDGGERVPARDWYPGPSELCGSSDARLVPALLWFQQLLRPGRS